MWGKIIIPMYRLWLHGLYGLYGPRCPLSPKRPINLISLSLAIFSDIYRNVSSYMSMIARPVKLSNFNTLIPRQNGRHFPDDIFKCIFLNESIWISIEISLKFVPKGQTNNIPALVQIMAWHRPGDKPLSEPMLVCLLTHICVTRPQWVKVIYAGEQVALCNQIIDDWCPVPLTTVISPFQVHTYPTIG